MNQSNRRCPRLPGKSSLIPTLFEIPVVFRVRYTCPTHQCWLDTLASPLGKIEQSHAFGCQQPLMTSCRGNINQLRLYVDGNDTQRLNYVHHQQRIVSTSGASDALEVRTEPGGKLDLADGDYPSLVVNKTN